MNFLFRVQEAGREFLLAEGTDPRYGARHLKRAVERQLVCPLANLLASGQVRAGDMLCVDWDKGLKQLVFWKEDDVSEMTARFRALGVEHTAPSQPCRTIEFPTFSASSSTF